MDEVILWKKELAQAGWKEVSLHAYQSPDGLIFRGPYKAWLIMNELKQHARSAPEQR